ncbi:hypothetical protein JOB18_013594 [Solea senegalensis]|uniref:Sushi domain-containing protein n=1 Tax=Solea senegalensis TaxID=28829 RepID=A0AAV6SSS8_SOLSE|nr:sushi domain-containing protein 3 isoform X2 [Solea senegalensis]KAG7519673.1 hypothetical protein JOB18_013594 [Solea senegalensis]
MSAATASVADVSRTDRDDARHRNNSGRSPSQCAPIPLPALGTQKIVQGNGTTVGTVISLQCPAKHKLIGKQLTCVLDKNSTHWEGKTFCQPLTPYEDYGFRVAVVASIISSAIILLMSMAFITCCWVDCIKKEAKKKQERASNMCQFEEQVQHRDNNWSHFSHKGRNNNNNTQEKMLSLWDTHNLPACDNRHTCRCHQEFSHRLVHTYSPSLPHLAPLPGHDYEQPLMAQNPPPPQYPGPNLSPYQTTSPSLVQISATGPGLVWQYERPHIGPSTAEDFNTRSSNHAKEFSIRIISV